MKGIVIVNSETMAVRLCRLPGLVVATVGLLLAWVIGIGFPPHAPAEESQYLTGQLLVATPEMRDPRFAKSVIYMVSHNKDGAMGVVVNRPLATGPISDIFKRLGLDTEGASGKITLHYGGPVQPGQGFVLHSNDYVREDSIVVRNGLALSGDVEVLRAISRGKGPRRSLLLLGYAGWAPGQLEAEIKANDWFTIPAEEILIFDEDAGTKWDRAMDRRKIAL